MSFDPGATQVALDEGADRLEKAADALYEATLRYEKADEAWDRFSLVEEAQIAQDEDRYGRTSERTRQGIVLKAHGEDPRYLEYVAARAEKNALAKRYDALKASVNARQSLLRVRGG